MKIHKIHLDKEKLAPIIRQTDRISLSWFSARKANGIPPPYRAHHVHGTSVGVMRPFLCPATRRTAGERGCFHGKETAV